MILVLLEVQAVIQKSTNFLYRYQKINNFIVITISANAFLQNMVRIIVGTLIDIAKRENDLSISEIIKKNDRSYAGKTAF